MLYKSSNLHDSLSLVLETSISFAQSNSSDDQFIIFISNYNATMERLLIPDLSYSSIEVDLLKDKPLQYSILGTLEYLFLSPESSYTPRLVSVILYCFKNIKYPNSDFLFDENEYGFILNELTYRLLRLVDKFNKEIGNDILTFYWDWLLKVAINLDNSNVEFSCTTLLNLLSATGSSPAEIHLPFQNRIIQLLDVLFDLNNMDKCFGNGECTDFGSNIYLFVFMFIKEFTAGSLNIDCEWKWAEVVGEGKGKGQFIWDNLLESTSSSNSYKIKPNAKLYSPVIDSIYRLCWKEEWKAKFKNYCNTADDYECFDSMLPFIVQSSSFCALHESKISVEQTNVLFEILETNAVNASEIINIDVYINVVEALGILACEIDDVKIKELTISRLTSFLTSPSNLFAQLQESSNQENSCAIMRQCVSIVLSKVLTNIKKYPSIKSTLFSLINAANSFSSSKSAAINATILQNSLSGITCLAPILKASDVIENVFPVFSRRFTESSREWDDVLYENLGNIALKTTDQNVFKEIIDLFLEQSKSEVKKLSRVTRTLAKVTGLPRVFRDIYLTKIISILLNRAENSQKDDVTGGSIDEIKEIAYIFKYICDQVVIENNANKSTTLFDDHFLSLFRNIWLYMTLVVLPASTNSGPTMLWGKDWNRSLESIASATPALLLPENKKNIEADLLSNSILVNFKISENLASKIRSNLAAVLHSKPHEIKHLSQTMCIYFLTVYHLEMFRVRRKFNVDDVLRYLTDDRNSEHLNLLESIADDVLKFHIRDKTHRQDMESIEEHLKSLIINAAHRLSRVRKFCQRKINEVIREYPQMLWNQNLVHLMIDILHLLDSQDFIKEDSGLQDRLRLNMSFIEPKDKIEASDDYLRICTNWLHTGMETCPKEMHGLFQSYTSKRFVKTFAFLPNDDSKVASLFRRFCSNNDFASSLVSSLSKQGHYIGEINGILDILDHELPRNKKWDILSDMIKKGLRSLPGIFKDDLYLESYSKVMHRAGALLLAKTEVDEELISLIAYAPTIWLTIPTIEIAVSVWSWIMSSRPAIAPNILSRLIGVFECSAIQRQGAYSLGERVGPFFSKMTYAASAALVDKDDYSTVHLIWLEFFHERFKVMKNAGSLVLNLFVKLFHISAIHLNMMRMDIACRPVFFSLMCLGFNIMEQLEKNSDSRVGIFTTTLYDSALSWFAIEPMWGNPKHFKLMHYMKEFHIKISAHKIVELGNTSVLNCLYGSKSNSGDNAIPIVSQQDAQELLGMLLESEINRGYVWNNIIENVTEKNIPQSSSKWQALVRSAWSINPGLAIHLNARYVQRSDIISVELTKLVRQTPLAALNYPEALPFLTHKFDIDDNVLRNLLYWSPISPIAAIYFLSSAGSSRHPWIIQYSIRVLEYFPVDQVFFYIPQMVQGLRYDSFGYIEKFILETAKSSQLFAHQIIWNMKANMFKDGDSKVPDPLKPALEKIISKIVNSISGSDKEFYEREFRFFSEVTGISGKLKPYIQQSKLIKKQKIDEEMKKIRVELGVYLPSNPESIVTGIDYDSGRPLQSHAKAPFLATFKIKKAGEEFEKGMSLLETSVDEDVNGQSIWQSAIFKVGDDCRQDVLALQLISIFKNIFEKAGIETYLYPYRVVATEPGCGVIEVIPNSISRDMMGREKVNSLFDYFVAHYGSPDSLGFQKARVAFIKSLAPSSLILYLLQIKDRHNGNIMFDDEGHIIHIDFGFILDISPGGINFESAPFKLTTEMVQVLGGDANTPSYKYFAELVVKSYIACRPFANEIIHMVSLMIDSSLPCFKGDLTIQKLRERFQLNKTERAAAEFMVARIRESHENTRSKLYDGFQFLQNGIPH